MEPPAQTCSAHALCPPRRRAKRLHKTGFVPPPCPLPLPARPPCASGPPASWQAVTIMVKQARALFRARVDVAFDGKRCDVPTLVVPTAKNAYFIHSSRCVVLLPGLLVAPFAGRGYDDASLMARLGYVIAHELAHATSDPTMWTSSMHRFLARFYPHESTYNEGLADLVAIAAVARTNVTTTSELCSHVSELWCGLEGTGTHVTEPTHPSVNARGDAMCAFLGGR